MQCNKLSKLEAYRLYYIVQCSWSLVIRYNGNEEMIISEMRRIYTDIQTSITKLPKSCPTLARMRAAIDSNRWVSEISKNNSTSPT